MMTKIKHSTINIALIFPQASSLRKIMNMIDKVFIMKKLKRLTIVTALGFSSATHKAICCCERVMNKIINAVAIMNGLKGILNRITPLV
tara:strand:+ start:581 stop:847 length:267 start_codon:yes stop_codon:yes gene_type:complete